MTALNTATKSAASSEINTRLFRLESCIAMLATVEDFAAFQQLDASQQFAMLCDRADSVSQCRQLADAVKAL